MNVKSLLYFVMAILTGMVSPVQLVFAQPMMRDAAMSSLPQVGMPLDQLMWRVPWEGQLRVPNPKDIDGMLGRDYLPSIEKFDFEGLRTDCKQLQQAVANSAARGTVQARGYARKCLFAIDTLPPVVAAAVADVVGVLFDRQSGVFCTATLVRNDRLLTARHCWEDILSGKREAKAVVFVRTGGDAYAIRAMPDRDASKFDMRTGQSYQAYDYVLLALELTVPGILPRVRFDDPQFNERLLLVGFYDLLTPHPVLDTTDGKIHELIRYDKEPACMAAPVGTTACLMHACASTPGSSGAPIFRHSEVSGGALVIVGVHGGASSTARRPAPADVRCPHWRTPDDRFFGNYAVSMREEVRRNLGLE